MLKRLLPLSIFLMLVLILIQFPYATQTSASGALWREIDVPLRFKLLTFKTLRMTTTSAPLSTIVVTTTADNLDSNAPTVGSLRWAIREANLNFGPDLIEFNIPGGGPHTINVGAGLPDITDTVTIDGYSQPGASVNTLAAGDNAVLQIEVAGQPNLFGNGFVLAASDCVLQGLAIHGFNHAVLVTGDRTVAGASGNIVRGNFIGTNISGSAVSGDQNNGTGNFNGGIYIDSGGFNPIGFLGTANDNIVGGTTPPARNVISGNGAFGVRISTRATGNLVQGNFIGTNAAGTAALGGGEGIFLASSGNTIGGTAAGARNVISGNNYNNANGISICCGASNNLVQGNYIGTDVTGNAAIPNGFTGVSINGGGSNDNIVGGSAVEARNIISSNTVLGVSIGNTSGTKVQGNYIGTNAAGTAALGNGFNGVYIEGAFSATVGGPEPGAGNVISAHPRGGVDIAANNIVVQGNLIGTKADGVGSLGNAQFGVRVRGANNLIGGRTSGEGNTIAFTRIDYPFSDAATGVIVFGTDTNVTIVGNTIHDNEGLGIDLGRDGATANDNCDLDLNDGTNNRLQNYPVIASAAAGGSDTTIQGTLNSAANNTFTLDFYANPACDSSGAGEGQTYLGSSTIATDATCTATFNAVLPISVSAGQYITATATDPFGNTSEFSVCVQLTAANSPPDAVDDAVSTNEDKAVTISVLSNDSDPDADALTITGYTQGNSGTVLNNGDGTLTYTPNADFFGNDTFTYSINDGLAYDTATVSVNVISVNDAPVAESQSITTDEDTPRLVQLIATDVDHDQLSFSIVSNVTNGILTGQAPNLNYTPNANYHGLDTFEFKVTDGVSFSNIATVTMSVSSVNDPPLAVRNQAVTDEDTPVVVDVLSNDTDADGDTLTVTGVTRPLFRGTVIINPDGTVTYTPPANFFLNDSFSYTIDDGNGGTSTAAVNIQVNPVNDPPTAVDDVATVAEDSGVIVPVLSNDRDIDEDPLTLDSVTQGTYGSVSKSGNQAFYFARGNYFGLDTFTYTISDGHGGFSTATVRVNVTPVNDPPVSQNDNYTMDAGTTLTVEAPGVLSNDTDIDGDALGTVLVSSPTRGTLTLNLDGSFSYTPNPNTGCDFFSYRAKDGKPLGLSEISTVTIIVNPLNDPLANFRANETVVLVQSNSVAARLDDPLKLTTSTMGRNAAQTNAAPTPTPSWSRTGNLNSARFFHTSSLLGDGKVLVAGGANHAGLSFFIGNGLLKTAELYDPTPGTWRRTSDLNAARANHTATVLRNGKVLVVGGTGANGIPLKTAEIYDPTTSRWTITSVGMSVGRALHTATLLTDGKVLITGGAGTGIAVLGTAEVYDPATETFTRVRNLNFGRWGHTANLLHNGKVLVAGGYSFTGSLIQNTAELYNPTANTWTRTRGNLNAARSQHATTTLFDGKVLVVGGISLNGILNSAEVFDPATELWKKTGVNMSAGRWSPTATVLRDGRVLVAGGASDCSFSLFPASTAELYDPATDRWTKTANLFTSRHSHTATLLYNNRILVVGGLRAAGALNSAELYDSLDRRPLTSTCSGVQITQFHGEGFAGNSRIARIENGKVPCMNSETGQMSECLFTTNGVSAGLMWAEAVDGQYAKTGQAITLQGEPGGEWIVAARVGIDGNVPCVAGAGHDTMGVIESGRDLSASCTIEDLGAAYNAGSAYFPYWSPLQNYADLEVCTTSNPHPDEVYPSRIFSSCNGTIYCYTSFGAALNDLNGTERGDSYFGYYLSGERFCHYARNGGFEVPAAKRPASLSTPAPGRVNVNSPILWRPVVPNLRIAN